MNKIAIQGHLTKGNDVIKILKALGGINIDDLKGKNDDLFYWIHNGEIQCDYRFRIPNGYKYYTLEEYEQQINIMEKRNIQIDLITAREWYKQGGNLKEIALQAFSEKELQSLPASWKEYCEIDPYLDADKAVFLLADGNINPLSSRYCAKRNFPGAMSSKERAEQFLTLNKLLQIRDYYNQGWEPDWTNINKLKYCIHTDMNQVGPVSFYSSGKLFTFKTKELRNTFFENFKEDLEKIKEFL